MAQLPIIFPFVFWTLSFIRWTSHQKDYCVILKNRRLFTPLHDQQAESSSEDLVLYSKAGPLSNQLLSSILSTPHQATFLFVLAKCCIFSFLFVF